jgi:hypothetical protein
VTPAVVLAGLIAAREPCGPPPPPAPPPPKPVLSVPIVHDLALMTVMRGVESYLWPDPFSRPKYFGDHYKEAFTKPPIFDPDKPAFQWDGDSIRINVVGHGLFGSELYMRARQCHVGALGSLAVAAASSTLWEYVFEGNGVRPSAQDLVYTPLAGMVFGELRYLGYNAAGRIVKRVPRTVLQAILDPLGEVERLAGTPC